MPRRICSLVFLSFVLLAPSARAQGNELHVDAAAPPGYEDGTVTYPFHAIQDALDVTLPGDVVRVHPGVYYGAIELADQVQLVSTEGPTMTVIDGMGAFVGAVIAPPSDGFVGAPTSYIEGFTIRNPGSSSIVYCENRRSFWGPSYFDIHRCVLRGDGSQTALKLMPSVQAKVTRSEVRDCGRALDAIWCKPELQNLTIHDVESAFFLYQPTSFRVYNTSVTTVPKVVELWGHHGYATVTGSNNNFHEYAQLGAPNQDGLYPVLSWTDNLFVDPQYRDPDLGDFRLLSSSPLVDAGLDVGLAYFGSAPDIGAYEQDATPTDTAEGLAESYALVPLEVFKSPEEQRRNAMSHKLIALIKSLDAGADDNDQKRIAGLNGARHRLMNDIWDKSDGHFGGQPANDWILSEEEQARLKDQVDALLAGIDAELSALE